jgi:lysophospholipase L1-like esterase
VPNYNAALRGWGLANNVPVVDAQRFFELLPSDLFSDECHFTPQGYERMAKLVREEVVTAKQGSPQSEQRQATGETQQVR